MSNTPYWRELVRQGIGRCSTTDAPALRQAERELDDAGAEAAHALVDAIATADPNALPVEADALHDRIDEAAAADAFDLAVLTVHESLTEEERAELLEADRERHEVADAQPRPVPYAPAGVRMRGPDSIYTERELAALRDRTHSVTAPPGEPIPSAAILAPARPRACAGLAARSALGRRTSSGQRRTRSASSSRSSGGGSSGDDGSDLPDPPPPPAEPHGRGDEQDRGEHDQLDRRGGLLPAGVYVARVLRRLGGGGR